MVLAWLLYLEFPSWWSVFVGSAGECGVVSVYESETVNEGIKPSPSKESGVYLAKKLQRGI